MEFTKIGFKNFREDVEKALKGVGEKYQLDISLGNISYSEFSFNSKLTCTKVGEDIEKKQFEKLCLCYGFKPEDYGKTFTDQGKLFRLTGFNERATKNPCMLLCLTDNKTYSAPLTFVKDCIQTAS